MPTLYLLRHAKSSWEEPARADHERPLAPRGIRACALIADHLRKREIAPDLVLCSTAVRTRETLAGVRDGFVRPPRVSYEAAVYEATAADLIALLGELPAAAGGREDPRAVMLIGHQPGIGELATTLAASGERLADLAAKFPTAALATLELERPWAELGPGCARLVDFVKPKELARAR